MQRSRHAPVRQIVRPPRRTYQRPSSVELAGVNLAAHEARIAAATATVQAEMQRQEQALRRLGVGG